MSSLVSIIDLTASHGLYALAQLGAPGPADKGRWPAIALIDSPTAPRLDWHRPANGAALQQLQLHSDAVVLLVGPGAAPLLQPLLALLGKVDKLWVLMTPSSIVESIVLEAALPVQLPQAQLYKLPNSEAQTLWFILLEQLEKLHLLPPAVPLSPEERKNMASNLKESMSAAMGIDGALAAALVDHRSGMCLAQQGAALDLDLAAAGNTQVVQAKLKTMATLGLRQGIEDILITLGEQYHLIRMAPNHPGLFLYLVLDKAKGNLALARYKLTDIERSLVV